MSAFSLPEPLRGRVDALLAHYERLAPRERTAVILAGVALAGFAFYSLLWEPVHKAHLRAERALDDARSLNAWVSEASAKLRAAGAPATVAPAPVAASPMAAIEQAGREAGLASALKRREPEGETGVRAQFEDVDFDRLVRMLALLETRFGLVPDSLELERRDGPGKVNVRLVLKRPAAS
ncbi:MAG: type II secretion system protein M [Halothiobacillaceae bacterium]|jgi:general secretion pathway protein M|nr:type II secretion system protein M [Halothiobacillaceae bacterium]MDY0049255.1 type II secretion system protein M [Halothiobacillaceae bacterium]